MNLKITKPERIIGIFVRKVYIEVQLSLENISFFSIKDFTVELLLRTVRIFENSYFKKHFTF